MTIADRDSLIALLDKLGSTDDAEVLAAARALDQRLRQEGRRWDDLLLRDGDDGEAARGVGATDEPDDDDVAGATQEPAESVGDASGDLEAIERLLATYDLSPDTREMLTDLKEEIKDGTFSAADRRYVQGLQARLGKPAKRK